MVIFHSVLLRKRNIPEKHCRENQNTYFMSNNFFFENRAVYEIIYKNTVELDRPQMTVGGMRISSWISKATNTHSIYVILITFPQQRSLHKRASVLNSTCIGWLVFLPSHPTAQRDANNDDSTWKSYDSAEQYFKTPTNENIVNF